MLIALRRPSSPYVALSRPIRNLQFSLNSHSARSQRAWTLSLPQSWRFFHTSGPSDVQLSAQQLKDWELTVGIEIHAQLNTERKLFSKALTSLNDRPNSYVSIFDLALPGSQPVFQKATLIPALRAAIALGCNVQRESKFDRKHYFYADQPAGYQITQYYKPFATNGAVQLFEHDGIESGNDNPVSIGIKQIQIEQDTAKTVQQPPSTSLLDFNRVSHPLIEIITLPQIHHPRTAAAFVRKVQAILLAVNAVTIGMEQGGMRADVNVSVRARQEVADETDACSNGNMGELGQRTEIKNLSSFRAIEEAVTAERDRQIRVLRSGGTVQGETRGWALGSTETVRLRAKEGEVDYRYMPDPDIKPLIIGNDLIDYLRKGLPALPDETLNELVNDHGLTLKDAKTLMDLDNGARLEYFDEVFNELRLALSETELARLKKRDPKRPSLSVSVANWVLHELGGLLTKSETPFSPTRIEARALAHIIKHLLLGRITGRTGKHILARCFSGDSRSIDAIIEEDNLGVKSLSHEEYTEMAQDLLRDNAELAKQIQEKGQVQKVKWFVGQMMRKGEGKIAADKAEATLLEVLQISKK